MSDYLPTVGVYCKDFYVLELLINFLESNGFKVFKNPKSLKDIDYLVIDFSGGLPVSDFSDLLKNLNKKCLVLVSKDQKDLANEILDLNDNLSVGILAGEKDTVYDYSENILKNLMSFGYVGKTFSLKGKEVKKLEKIIEEEKTKEVEVEEKEQIVLPQIKKPKKNLKIKLPYKKISLVFISLILIFLLPMFSIILSSVSVYVSLKKIPSNPSFSKRTLFLSHALNGFTKTINYGVPFYINLAESLDQGASVVGGVINTFEITKTLMSNITDNRQYDLNEISSKLSAELDLLYVNLGFLKSQVDSFNNYPLSLVKAKLNSSEVDLGDISKKIYAAKEVSSNLNEILGGEKAKKYLILFQNNMEIRPTGGFIGSFAIVTFEKGRLIDVNVSDVYSADGQLNGHVDPPQAIKDVLGEGGWYMRDANWDPDFPTSASKIEWFLDKEVSEQVDGVIGIDLNLVQKLLDVTGPIELPEIGKVINSENLYLTVQNEVEDNFFPGSIKKATVLSSLSSKLIEELENLSDEKKPEVLKQVYLSLEERHMQIFLHQQNVQRTLSSLDYTGSVDVATDCGLRCFKDSYYLVDANLGVNKANYFINRSQELYLNLNKENIKHELQVTYTNSANVNLGNDGKYKNYARLIIPKDSTVGSVRVYHEGGTYENIEYKTEEISGRKEIGFLLEVLPSTSSKLQISWTIPQDEISQGGEYRLKVNKQAGTINDSLAVYLNQSELIPQATFPEFSLTNQGVYLYNTDLGKSFDSRIFLK